MAIAESPVADAIFEALGKDSIQYLADHFVFHRIAFYLLAVGPAEGGGIVGDLGGGKVSGDVACLKSVEGEQLAHLFGTAISGIGLYTIHGLGGEASEGGAHLFGTLCHADGLPCSHRANRDVVDEKSEKAFRRVFPTDVFCSGGNRHVRSLPLHIGGDDGVAEGERLGCIVRRAETYLESIIDYWYIIIITLEFGIKRQVHLFGDARQFGRDEQFCLIGYIVKAERQVA